MDVTLDPTNAYDAEVSITWTFPTFHYFSERSVSLGSRPHLEHSGKSIDLSQLDENEGLCSAWNHPNDIRPLPIAAQFHVCFISF